ncbi:T9SS type B sorting domain-containing protein [Aureisphaera galaxeae]|uniref:T9SS type B sorting domain-containing protein n=1 Tax=Aureisphaera galaxeae TaxID=1538023 RepID=UPI002350698A|nr:T9SS type B sorting domain-containing protein [Aureisphaera galaxeae]MDC8002589.1 T9SS type B sorting domain-containing protein [Aureisphaera galaxeae]
MNKTTVKRFPVYLIILFLGIQAYAQNYVPFTPRFDQDLKGDIVLIGNNILGPDNNPFNDNTAYNHQVDMQYIDIDSDPTTFSSSSADLQLADPSCYQIIHAGLYWSAVTKGTEPFDTVKFQGPGGSYVDITGTVIFDANGVSVDGGDSFPYACYADVTSIVTGLGSGANLGTYTVANISSALGETSTFDPYNGTGYSAGWSLFIVYEDPRLPGKSITSFDGFSAISVPGGNTSLDIPVSGFRTVPAPAPVRANFAFATLEGDKPITGDQLNLNGSTLSTIDRPATNFFHSSVTQLNATPVNDRNPNSTNTLGFDTGVMVVPNPGNTVIANDATAATITVSTSGDTYFPYFMAMAVEIIEPNIVLTKIVEDEFGNDIGGQVVGLGQDLNYVIGFQNTGNDDATNFTIRDILPINIIYNHPTDLVLPAGVTVQSYNPTTRELIFDIDDSLVEENDPAYEIRIEVQVVDTCQQLAAACSDLIQNQAFATYQGTLNPTFIITDDPSHNSNAGCLINPEATNFLADLDDCVFVQNETLCGDSLTLTAADGYVAYSWSTDISGTPVIGTGQSITVTATGTYYSFNTAAAPCRSIVQQYDVTLFGGSIPNPIIPYADEVVICPNDGKELPNIYLCGEDDFRDLNVDIASAIDIFWEVLDESSCPPVSDPDCANEDNSCTWNIVGTGPDYTANTAGQYRLTINYEGGCFNQFFFNVYQNVLDPVVTVTDIICTTPGTITVSNVPANYEYSLDGINFQASNVFSVTSPGIYTVYIQQVGVPTGACLFTVPDVLVRARDFTVSSIVEQPLCNGDLGSIFLAANDAEPQYFFSLYQGATLVNAVGPITDNTHSFLNLNPGTYTAVVETEDGCTHTEDITIIEPDLLTVTAALTVPLTCTDGEITIYPVGGTPPYFYFINSSTVFQTVPEYVVTAPGVYNITVVDANNCSAQTSITVEATPPPEFNVLTTDIQCADDGDAGIITIDVINANGHTLQFSIDGGATFSTSPVFTGLAAGSYDVVVEYTIGPSVCLSDPQTVTIDAATAISGTAELTSPYTCTSSGTITVTTVTGGDPPYTYSIDGINFQSSPTFTGLTAGTYTVTIMDSSGCTAITNDITIPALDPPTDLMFSNTPLTCPTNLVDITITGTTGGVAPLEYQIIAPAAAATPYQASNVFTGLAPDVYTFQVRDANDCTYSESYAVAPLPTIDIVAQTISNVTCFGADDGSVQFTVSGTTTFEYTINGGAPIPGASPITLNGLGAGSYTILVTDLVTNCQATATADVAGPTTPLSIALEISPITCVADGSAVINAAGGWGGYVYTLTLPDTTTLPPQGSNTFTNLTQAGTYTIEVEDAGGCVATDTFDLTTPTLPTATISTSSDLCFDSGDNASIIVDATSGQPPYEYSINGGPYQSSNVFADLGPGSYVVTVRDSFGCEVTLPAQIIAPELLVDAVLTDSPDCTPTPDAAITGTITGGTAAYTYAVSINGGGFTPLGATGPIFTYSTATPGTYQFEVTDATGCTATSPIVTINPVIPPVIDLVTQTEPILCNGDSNGAIDISYDPTVGTPPFLINVFNDTTGTDYGTQTTGLPAGDYTITLTDANSCTDTETITITEPDPIVVDFTTIDIQCFPGGTSQGSIIINSVVGGTAPYNYFVTGSNGYSASEFNATGTTSVTFNVIDFGLYEINIVDSNGCSVLFQDVLIASPPDDLDITVASTVDCATGGQAVVTVSSILGSTGPFWFTIYQGPISVYPNPPGSWIPEDAPGSQSATFTGLTPGLTYTFIVYDESTMCSYFEPATTPIPTNSTLTTSAESSDNVTCTGSDDGDVSFTVNSIYAAPVNVSYEIFDSLTLITTGISGTGVVPAGGSLTVSDLGPLPFGNYYVLIEETSGPNVGCGVATAPFSITESAILLELTASVDQNANCNPNSGVVSAIAQNGTAPYVYQITTTPGAPAPTDPSWDPASTFNVDAGSYYVHVMDAFECIITSPVQVVDMDPEPVIDAVTANQCSTPQGQFEIDVTLTTAGIPPYSVSIDGGGFQAQTFPFTISGLSSGTHTVEVVDANGCGNLVTLDIEPPLGLTPEVTAQPTCDDDDGEITITATGGTGGYSYSISPNPPTIVLTGNVFSGVPSGTYTVTVTDTTTLCTEDISVTLENAIPVTFDTEVTDVSCNAGNDGQIIVDLLPGNDNPVYTYEITAPIVVPPQTSNIFTGLTAGTYTVQVTSGRDCVATADVPIAEPLLLEATGTATAFVCIGDNVPSTSTITITETGGTADFDYSIDGTNYFDTNVFEVIDTGITQVITVYVRDANNCIATNTVTIDPLPIITATSFTEVTPIDCNQTGSVAINVTGGSGNFEYELLPDGPTQASNVFAIPGPGTYYYQVNDLDTNCYFLTDAFEVPPFDLIDATLAVTQENDCFGATDGELELTISGYSGAYTYQILDGSGAPIGGPVAANTSTNPQIITGLPAGNYSIEIVETDSPFCSTNTDVVNIGSPPTPLVLDASETSNVTCNNNVGIITALADGGTAPYEYELTGDATVPYSSNNVFENLSAGNYVVNARDANGCIESFAIVLMEPDPIDADFVPSTTTLSCFGDQDASITIENVTGGQNGNYTYTLNTISPTPSTSGPQLSNVFEGLGAGTYTVTIEDGYDCSLVSLPIIISEPDTIISNLVAETTPTCLVEAQLTLSAVGGTGGTYEYSETPNFAVILGSFTTSVTFSVPPGTYSYYVRDVNGCVDNASNEITIDPLPELMVEVLSDNPQINCAGDNTGVIVATAQGGLGNYVYELQDANGNPIAATQDPPGTFTELPVGVYIVQVESGDCLSTSEDITITEPEFALQADFEVTNVLCQGENNGRLEILAEGGSGIYLYAISPRLDQYFETGTFENLEPGNYDAIVQDELGCFLTFNFNVTEPPAVLLGIVPDSTIPEICEGDMDGFFSIEVEGGTLPYSVSLDDPDGEYTQGGPTQTMFDFDNLGGGDHIVYVRDSLGCESEWNITFPESVALDPGVNVEVQCIDNVSTNVVTVEVDETAVDLTQLEYSLNDGPFQSSNIFTDLPASTDNFITVRHTNGCTKITELFDVQAVAPVWLFLEEGELNEIVAIANGGNGEFTYTFNGEDFGGINVFTITASGTFEVIVTDSSGCSAVALVEREFIDICIPDYFTPNGDGVQDGWTIGCAPNYPNLIFSIYDRYGRKVATLRAGEMWDGKYNGSELPTGDYWFIVETDRSGEVRDFVGHFTLYR